MDKNEIVRVVQSAKIPNLSALDVPTLSKRVEFVDEQIGQMKSIIWRCSTEIDVYKFYLESPDHAIREAGEQKLKQTAAELKSYHLTLKGLRRVRASLALELKEQEKEDAKDAQLDSQEEETVSN